MATQLPAKLKSLDIQRFALRASQLETAKPSIAYWCEYWIVNQILAKGLHTSDAECLQYTTALMDKLEQTKTQYADDDVIVDDTAGQAFVEQFGLETFERADRAIRANKATKQTADTFLAAATFLELMNIWGEPEAEIHSKILYAKWNAARIIKAIKEGSDPNESNPRPKPAAPEDNIPSLEPHNPGVQPVKPFQASVEEDPSERYEVEPALTAQYNDAPVNPWAQHPIHPLSNVRYATSHQPEGGHFPEVPITNFAAETQSSKLPTEPPEPPEDTMGSQRRVSSRPTSFRLSKSSDELPAPSQNIYGPPHVPQQPVYRETPSPMFPASESIKPLRQQTYVIDDVAMAKAQKHARWAISALNFEDVNTAVQELQEALRTLGAS